MDRGTWMLSPAFDLNPDPAAGDKHLSTAIDGYDTSASIELLMSVAGPFRLSDDDAVSVLAEVLEAAATWRHAAATQGIPEAEIEAMTWAFAHPETDVARAVVGAGVS